MFLFLTFIKVRKSSSRFQPPSLKKHHGISWTPAPCCFIPRLTTCSSLFVQSSPAVLDTNGLPNVAYDFAKISGLLPTTWQENIGWRRHFHCCKNVGGCQCLCRKYTENTHIKYTSPQRTYSNIENDWNHTPRMTQKCRTCWVVKNQKSPTWCSSLKPFKKKRKAWKTVMRFFFKFPTGLRPESFFFVKMVTLWRHISS